MADHQGWWQFFDKIIGHSLGNLIGEMEISHQRLGPLMYNFDAVEILAKGDGEKIFG